MIIQEAFLNGRFHSQRLWFNEFGVGIRHWVFLNSARGDCKVKQSLRTTVLVWLQFYSRHGHSRDFLALTKIILNYVWIWPWIKRYWHANFSFWFQNYICVKMRFQEIDFHHYHKFMMFCHKTCISPHHLKIGKGKGKPFTQFSLNLKERGLLGSCNKPFFLILTQLSEKTDVL